MFSLFSVFELFINHQATKDVYYDVINHCKERVRHSKLLVLGHVAAGKSSLVRTLSGKEFCQDRHITDGIHVHFSKNLFLIFMYFLYQPSRCGIYLSVFCKDVINCFSATLTVVCLCLLC